VPPSRPPLGEQQPSRVTLRCRGAVSSVPGPGEERGGPSEETRISRWLRTGTTGSAPTAVVAAAGRSPAPGAGNGHHDVPRAPSPLDCRSRALGPDHDQ
jgi:hypothetical protein